MAGMPKTALLTLLATIVACAHSTERTPPAGAEAPVAQIAPAELERVLRFESRSLDDVVADARQHGKAILIELGAPWCQPCRIFERHVLTQPEAAAALSQVTWIRYDVEQPAGREVSKIFSASVLPLFVVLDSEGATRARFFGAPNSVEVLSEVVRQAALLGQSEAATAALASAKANDPEILLWVGRWHKIRDRSVEARNFFERAINVDRVGEIAKEAKRELGQVVDL
jgi:thioredoxin-like negative regulator of GroEL